MCKSGQLDHKQITWIKFFIYVHYGVGCKIAEAGPASEDENRWSRGERLSPSGWLDLSQSHSSPLVIHASNFFQFTYSRPENLRPGCIFYVLPFTSCLGLIPRKIKKVLPLMRPLISLCFKNGGQIWFEWDMIPSLKLPINEIVIRCFLGIFFMYGAIYCTEEIFFVNFFKYLDYLCFFLRF